MLEQLINLLKHGFDVNFGKMSLCKIEHFNKDGVLRRYGWQIHSEEKAYLTSEFFKPEELEDAAIRFLFIRKVVLNARNSQLPKLSSDKQST